MEYNYNKNAVDKACKIILNQGLLICSGNGGSCDQSMHLVSELVGTFNGDNSSFPAIAIGTNQSELTAISNDISYDVYFTRYIQTFEKFDPAILFITTSGKSKNILNSLEYLEVKNKLNKTIVLTGNAEFLNKDFNNTDLTIISAYYNETEVIQEAHLHIIHQLARKIKKLR